MITSKKRLNNLPTIQLPRFLGNSESQLLCFCDSSNKTRETTIYFRVVSNRKATVNLIFPKTRYSHKKETHYPKIRADFNANKHQKSLFHC